MRRFQKYLQTFRWMSCCPYFQRRTCFVDFLSTFSSTFLSLLEKHPHPKLDVFSFFRDVNLIFSKIVVTFQVASQWTFFSHWHAQLVGTLCERAAIKTNGWWDGHCLQKYLRWEPTLWKAWVVLEPVNRGFHRWKPSINQFGWVVFFGGIFNFRWHPNHLRCKIVWVSWVVCQVSPNKKNRVTGFGFQVHQGHRVVSVRLNYNDQCPQGYHFQRGHCEKNSSVHERGCQGHLAGVFCWWLAVSRRDFVFCGRPTNII